MNLSTTTTLSRLAPMRRVPPRHRRAVCLAAWGIIVIAGFGYLTDYANTAGLGDNAPEQWPASSDIGLAADRPTLVTFIHPACPCSRSSLNEFARLMARAGDRLAAHVVFIRPNRMKSGWERTGLWNIASSVPGAQMITDVGGVEAVRFGAATSGYTVVYDTDGRLVFQGGITSARGHEGDNEGKSAILSWVNNTVPQTDSTPVFGCPLRDPHEICEAKE